MTLKNELQTLLATLDDSHDIWDALHDVIDELDTMEMLLDEVAHGTTLPLGHGRNYDDNIQKVWRKTGLALKLIQSIKKSLKSEAENMSHLIFDKAKGLTQEMIATEEKKIAKEKATELVNS